MRNLIMAMTFSLLATPAAAFDFSFDWSGLKSCTNGRPNVVANPAFTLKDVPSGTKYIRFKLKDRDVPSYNHGGGVVAYKGQKVIQRGAFKYKSPCPPSGTTPGEVSTYSKSRASGWRFTAPLCGRLPRP